MLETQTPHLNVIKRDRKKFCYFILLYSYIMNYIKEKIGKGLYVPQMAEKARQIGVQQVDHVEKQFPYLDQTLPSHEMTIDEKEKRLKKIENISNGLDNIFPWCPIPIGIGSVLVMRVVQYLFFFN